MPRHRSCLTRENTASRSVRFASTARAGTARSRRWRVQAGMRSGSACAWCEDWRPPTRHASSPRAPTSPSHRWTIKALRDEPLPLFTAAAEREARAIAEQQEPEVELRQMTDGHNVVEDYSHIGLTLREHPLRFLRADLTKRRIVTCAEAMTARDGQWLMAAGLVLVRQRPGSAKGVMFITIEDETGIANIVVWPKLFERSRRVVLGASMMAINGRIQREGEVVHLVAQQLFDF